MENHSHDSEFYEALKKSQPIAFLASLSIVIAAFTYEKIPLVYNDAVMAGIMFLISFIVSLADQFFTKKDADGPPLFRWGKFFFMIIGLIFIGLMMSEFGKSLPQLTYVSYSWFGFTIGGFLLSTVLYRKGRFYKRFSEGKWDYKLLVIFSYISGSSFLLASFTILGHVLFKYNASREDIILFLEIVAAVAIVSLFLAAFVIFLGERIRQRTIEK